MAVERRKARIREDLRSIAEEEAEHTRTVMTKIAELAERLGGIPDAGDVLVHIQRARDAAGAPDEAITVHRATVVRQNLRFAAELLTREV